MIAPCSHKIEPNTAWKATARVLLIEWYCQDSSCVLKIVVSSRAMYRAVCFHRNPEYHRHKADDPSNPIPTECYPDLNQYMIIFGAFQLVFSQVRLPGHLICELLFQMIARGWRHSIFGQGGPFCKLRKVWACMSSGRCCDCGPCCARSQCQAMTRRVLARHRQQEYFAAFSCSKC